VTRSTRFGVADERGQTLVFFVVILAGLVLVLALVIDVGAWLRTQRKLQTVADAAALAAVPELPFDQGAALAKADAYAQQNLPGVDLLPAPAFPDQSTITVAARHDVPGIFAPLAGILNVSVQATATARVEAPTSLHNLPADGPNALTTVTVDPSYVAPIVVNENTIDACLSIGSSCFGSPQTLNLDTGNRIGSSFGIANLGSSSSRFAFRSWVACNGCVGGTIDAGSSFAPLTRGTAGTGAVTAMNTLTGKTVIFPVFDDFDGSRYHIVGFSAFVVTSTFDGATNWQAQNSFTNCQPDCKVIDGYFVNYTTPGTLSTSPGSAQNFGVRVIGLTG
jgi:Flp pilus assembly protein TadG